MSEKAIDLENGLELVISGNYKLCNYEREIMLSFDKDGNYRIFIRKKEK